MKGDSGIHSTSDIGLVCIFLSFGVCIYIFGLMMLKPREFRISDKKLCSNEFRAQILVALMLFFVMVVPAAASVTATIQTNKAAYSMATSNASPGARNAVARPGQEGTTRGDEFDDSRLAPAATTTSSSSSSSVDEASSHFVSKDWISENKLRNATRSSININLTNDTMLASPNDYNQPPSSRRATSCQEYNVTMEDSWGDGWNNAAVTFAQCNFCCKAQKYTTFMYSPGLHPMLGPLADLDCRHASHDSVAGGSTDEDDEWEDGDGDEWEDASGAWTSRRCEARMERCGCRGEWRGVNGGV